MAGAARRLALRARPRARSRCSATPRRIPIPCATSRPRPTHTPTGDTTRVRADSVQTRAADSAHAASDTSRRQRDGARAASGRLVDENSEGHDQGADRARRDAAGARRRRAVHVESRGAVRHRRAHAHAAARARARGDDVHDGQSRVAAVRAYAGNPGRVRVFLDGMEIDNLDPRAGGALDLAELQLWSLEQVTIERGADELRVYCRTWTRAAHDDLHAHRRAHRRPAHESLSRILRQALSARPSAAGWRAEATARRPTRALAAATSSRSSRDSAGRTRIGVSTATACMRIATRDLRQQDIGRTACSSLAFRAQNRTREDMYLRAGRGDPDSGVWAQAMVAHSTTSPRSTPLHRARRHFPLDSADTTRTSTQYIVTGGLTRWGLRLSGAERYHKLQTGGVSATELRASFEHRLLALSLYAERRGARQQLHGGGDGASHAAAVLRGRGHRRAHGTAAQRSATKTSSPRDSRRGSG